MHATFRFAMHAEWSIRLPKPVQAEYEAVIERLGEDKKLHRLGYLQVRIGEVTGGGN